MSIIKKEAEKIHMLNTMTTPKGYTDPTLIKIVEKEYNRWIEEYFISNFDILNEKEASSTIRDGIGVLGVCYTYAYGCYVNKITNIDNMVEEYLEYLKDTLGNSPLFVRFRPKLSFFLDEETGTYVCHIRSRIAKILPT